MEEWKDIEGYEGCYQVSNKGRVRSLDRYVGGEGNKRRFRKGQLLKGSQANGYVLYGLRKNHSRTTPHSNSKGHWLVMQAFGEAKPEWATMINHIDGDTTNNHIDNLEWSNVQLNNRHAREVLKTGQNIYRKCEIIVTSPDGHIVKYDSVSEAGKDLNLSYGRLSECARMGTSYKGYTAEYTDDYVFDNSTKRRVVILYKEDDDSVFHIFRSAAEAGRFLSRSRQTVLTAISKNYTCNGYKGYLP